MALTYNPASDCYEGTRVRVSAAAYHRLLAGLVGAGYAVWVALRLLDDEAFWTPVMAGVHERAGAPGCKFCGRGASGGRRFCDVVCEAEAVVRGAQGRRYGSTCRRVKE